jgi:hypothetical protein
MRIASFVLGLIGGIFGLFSAFSAMFVGGLGTALEAEGAELVTGLGFAAVFMGILLIVGASLIMGRRKSGRWLLLVGTAGGAVAVSAFWIVPGVLGLISTILAFMNKETANQ